MNEGYWLDTMPATFLTLHRCVSRIDVVGFVEGFTWGHVVIRDFKRKPTYIPHGEFKGMVVANWSRRPAKQCFFQLQIAPSLSGGAVHAAQLAKFVRNWIKAHEMIDLNTYSKADVKLGAGRGQVLEVIFYPKVGAKRKILRTEFIVMLMDAAQRLGLCILPVEIRTSTAWPNVPADGPKGSHRAEEDDEDDDDEEEEDEVTFDEQELLTDLMPSTGLRRRAGY